MSGCDGVETCSTGDLRSHLRALERNGGVGFIDPRRLCRPRGVADGDSERRSVEDDRLPFADQSACCFDRRARLVRAVVADQNRPRWSRPPLAARSRSAVPRGLGLRARRCLLRTREARSVPSTRPRSPPRRLRPRLGRCLAKSASLRGRGSLRPSLPVAPAGHPPARRSASASFTPSNAVSLDTTEVMLARLSAMVSRGATLSTIAGPGSRTAAATSIADSASAEQS